MDQLLGVLNHREEQLLPVGEECERLVQEEQHKPEAVLRVEHEVVVARRATKMKAR